MSRQNGCCVASKEMRRNPREASVDCILRPQRNPWTAVQAPSQQKQHKQRFAGCPLAVALPYTQVVDGPLKALSTGRSPAAFMAGRPVAGPTLVQQG